jgi:hypothetical protein
VVDRFEALIDSWRKQIETINERIDGVAKAARQAPSAVNSLQFERERLEAERRVWETAIENLRKIL